MPAQIPRINPSRSAAHVPSFRVNRAIPVEGATSLRATACLKAVGARCGRKSPEREVRRASLAPGSGNDFEVGHCDLRHLWKSDSKVFQLVNRPSPSHSFHIETTPTEGICQFSG